MLAQFQKAVHGGAHCHEVVDDKHVILRCEQALLNNNIENLTMGKRLNFGHILVARQVDGLRFFREHHGCVVEMACSNASDANPRCLDGQNLVDGLIRKQTRPFGAHFIKQRRVQLMIQKRTNF